MKVYKVVGNEVKTVESDLSTYCREITAIKEYEALLAEKNEDVEYVLLNRKYSSGTCSWKIVKRYQAEHFTVFDTCNTRLEAERVQEQHPGSHIVEVEEEHVSSEPEPGVFQRLWNWLQVQ